jgi:hypothetical protein
MKAGQTKEALRLRRLFTFCTAGFMFGRDTILLIEYRIAIYRIDVRCYVVTEPGPTAGEAGPRPGRGQSRSTFRMIASEV